MNSFNQKRAVVLEVLCYCIVVEHSMKIEEQQRVRLHKDVNWSNHSESNNLNEKTCFMFVHLTFVSLVRYIYCKRHG